MIRIIELNERADNTFIEMYKMEPLQVGELVDSSYKPLGEYVIRTSSTDRVEVMNLSSPGPDSCWTDDLSTVVRLLKPGEKIVVEFFNEEVSG